MRYAQEQFDEMKTKVSSLEGDLSDQDAKLNEAMFKIEEFGKEVGVYIHRYMCPVERYPVAKVLEMLLEHLKLEIKDIPQNRETFELVKRKKNGNP